MTTGHLFLNSAVFITSKAEKYPTDIIEVLLFQKPATKAVLSKLDFNYVSAATDVRVAWSYISRRLSTLWRFSHTSSHENKKALNPFYYKNIFDRKRIQDTKRVLFIYLFSIIFY